MGESEEGQEDRERISEGGVAAARFTEKRALKKAEMDVDFSNSRNATILRYLHNPYDFIMGPRAGVFREAPRRHGADHEDDHRAEPPRGGRVA